jgi:hypothetical protein
MCVELLLKAFKRIEATFPTLRPVVWIEDMHQCDFNSALSLLGLLIDYGFVGGYPVFLTTSEEDRAFFTKLISKGLSPMSISSSSLSLIFALKFICSGSGLSSRLQQDLFPALTVSDLQNAVIQSMQHEESIKYSVQLWDPKHADITEPAATVTHSEVEGIPLDANPAVQRLVMMSANDMRLFDTGIALFDSVKSHQIGNQLLDGTISCTTLRT